MTKPDLPPLYDMPPDEALKTLQGAYEMGSKLALYVALHIVESERIPIPPWLAAPLYAYIWNCRQAE